MLRRCHPCCAGGKLRYTCSNAADISCGKQAWVCLEVSWIRFSMMPFNRGRLEAMRELIDVRLHGGKLVPREELGLS